VLATVPKIVPARIQLGPSQATASQSDARKTPHFSGSPSGFRILWGNTRGGSSPPFRTRESADLADGEAVGAV
jgi:hypothetical protein